MKLVLTFAAVMTIVVGAQAQPNMSDVDNMLQQQLPFILNIILGVIVVVLAIGLAIAVNKVISGAQDSKDGIMKWGTALVLVIIGWVVITQLF